MRCPICGQPANLWRHHQLRATCGATCGQIFRAVGCMARNADVDEMAVVRLLEGWVVNSTRSERIEAVRVLTCQGRSIAWIADYLRITTRSVERYRHVLANYGKAA